MLARIKWSDLHRVNHPGIYLLPDGRSRVQVGAKHIVLWTADPDGEFDSHRHVGDHKDGYLTLNDFHHSDIDAR